MRLLFFMLPLLSLVLFCGCGLQPVKTTEVLIPTQCGVAKRERPKQSGRVNKDVIAIFAYAQSLEQDLKICRGER